MKPAHHRSTVAGAAALRDAATLWTFCRPHTMAGTALAVVTLYLVAAHDTGRHDLVLLSIVAAASLAVNVHVVGLNQLTDIGIDRINKPHLPLAAGTLGVERARRIVLWAGGLSLGFAALAGPALVAAVVAIAAVGSAYSLPPLRLKRRPLAAALAIASARAVIGNLGVYLTFTSGFGGPGRVPVHVAALVTFMFGFMIAIAILKDAPDAEGDRRYGVSTYAIRFGPHRVAVVAAWIVAGLQLGMIVLGILGLPGLHGPLTAYGHTALLAALGGLTLRCNPADRRSLSRFYRGIWALLYVELPLYAAACLLAGSASGEVPC